MKKLIINFIMFVLGGAASFVYFLNNPSIKIVEKEIESKESLNKITKLKQDLYFEKYNSSLLAKDLQKLQQQLFQNENETEIIEKIQKPDGTNIVVEKRTKNKTLNSTIEKSEEKTIQTKTSEEKETLAITKNEDLNYKKEFHSYEKEYSFNSSFSLGVGVSYNFEKQGIEYSFLSTYNFSRSFSLFFIANIIPSSRYYPKKISSFGFGISFVF